MPPVSLYRVPRANTALNSVRSCSAAGGSPRTTARGTACGSASSVVTAPHPEASTRRRSSAFTRATPSGRTSAQKPRSVAQGRSLTRSSSDSMYPSPCSQPAASSSRWSGVHIHVTTGSPFTSSHTGHSSTRAESAVIRPRRDPGGGTSRSGLAEVLGGEMGSLLNADRVELHAGRQRADQPLPEVHRQRFTGRQALARLEFRQVPVDVAVRQPVGDLASQERVQLREVEYAAGACNERPLHRDPALIAMRMVRGRLAEGGRVSLRGPVRPGDPLRRRKLHEPRKIDGRHGQNTLTALALKAQVTGAPG